MKLQLNWSSSMFGTDFYHLVASFVIYSILGWLVESIYMSICNKKLTNRGLAKGPFCPIYGFGATLGSLILKPFAGSYMALYISGAVIATAFEYFVGVLMIKFLGALWWDYDEKPYNYKGIICLESTLAWGFYAIGVVKFLNGFITRIVDRIEPSKMIAFMEIVFVIAVFDYTVKMVNIFHEPIVNTKDKVVKAYRNFHDRWF